MTFSHDEAARIEAAIRDAQARSTGQIVVVLAKSSANYEIVPFIWSAMLGFIAPWPLLAMTDLSAERIFLVQLTVFFLAVLLLTAPRLALLLTPARLKRANAHRAALEQFALRGLTHGAERNGVLLYISLAERFARVIADEGAAKVIPQKQWQTVIDRLLADMKRGGAADALISASSDCGDLLAQHFPPRDGVARPLFHRFHLV